MFFQTQQKLISKYPHYLEKCETLLFLAKSQDQLLWSRQYSSSRTLTPPAAAGCPPFLRVMKRLPSQKYSF